LFSSARELRRSCDVAYSSAQYGPSFEVSAIFLLKKIVDIRRIDLIVIMIRRMVLFLANCRLKAYCIDFLGRKINLSGISSAKRSRSGTNSVYVDRSRGDNVQVILGAIGLFWGKWGLGRVPQREFFCVVIQTTFRQLHNGRFSSNLVTKRISVSRRGIRKDIFEKFYFRGHLPKKSEIENRSNGHLTQSRLQVT